MVEKIKLLQRLCNLSVEDDVTVTTDTDVKIRSDTYRVRSSKDLMLLVRTDWTISSFYQR